MPSNAARYSLPFILIHWVLALVSFVLLGLGWYIKYIPPAPPALSFLLDLHRSLGLTAAILISIQILMRIVFKHPHFRKCLHDHGSVAMPARFVGIRDSGRVKLRLPCSPCTSIL